MSIRRVCWPTLAAIQAIRKDAHIHKYDVTTIIMNHRDVISPFEHTTGSFNWALAQAKKIDAIGIDAWIKLPDAEGYGSCAITEHQMK
jgi:hypothetical protein